MITFHIITLFPEAFSYVESSIIGRAQKRKKIKIKITNPRDFAADKHKTTDDRPYGGGPGMVMKAEPVLKAVRKSLGRKKKFKAIFFSAQGRVLTNARAENILKKYKDVVLIAGHYEGVDERVAEALKAEKVSIGPYVLTGGELPAMVMIDVITRRIKEVIGKRESLEEGRLASAKVYTRPEVFMWKSKNYRVPGTLLSGNHAGIAEWKRKNLPKWEKHKNI